MNFDRSDLNPCVDRDLDRDVTGEEHDGDMLIVELIMIVDTGGGR